MAYATEVCESAMTPKSPHHAAMLLLEQKTGKLSRILSELESVLGPAMRPQGPKPGGAKDNVVPCPASEMIAHADSICEEVDRCIDRVQDVLERLTI